MDDLDTRRAATILFLMNATVTFADPLWRKTVSTMALSSAGDVARGRPEPLWRSPRQEGRLARVVPVDLRDDPRYLRWPHAVVEVRLDLADLEGCQLSS